jgi:hypothetical protein
MSKKLSDNIHVYYKIMEIHYGGPGGVDTLAVPIGSAGTLMHSEEEALNTIKELLLTNSKFYTIIKVYC